MRPITNFSMFRCPNCKSGLIQSASVLFCNSCNMQYPLLNSMQCFLQPKVGEYFHVSCGRAQDSVFEKRFSWIRDGIRDFLFGAPNISSKNIGLIIEMCNLSGVLSSNPKNILIIGAGNGGAAVKKLMEFPEHHIYGLDVAAGNSVNVLADAHDLPFMDKSFDLVIIQAVLEHVIKPTDVVNEIRRVLRDGAVVYAETPFMQPVHEGIYDYQRYSLTGHRYLFKDFVRLKSGSIGGAALSLSWLIKAVSHKAFGRLSFLIWLPASCVLKIIDLTLYRNGDNIGMCGVFFLGKSSRLQFDEMFDDLKDSFRST